MGLGVLYGPITDCQQSLWMLFYLSDLVFDDSGDMSVHIAR